MPAITLFISPHLDDACFSAGALVASLAPGQAFVATCFTASVHEPTGFALRCQTDKGYAPEVDYMALRREEDVRACSILAAGFEHMDLPEAPHRGYGSPEALFAGIHESDSVGAELDGRLRDLLTRLSPVTVAYPVGVGDHVDHLQVIAAVGRVQADFPGLRWVRYYDQPYTSRHRRAFPELAFARRVRGLAEVGDDVCAFTYAPLDREPDGPLAAKLRAVAAYESQVGYQFFEAMGVERTGEEDVVTRAAQVLGRREWFITE